jgi:hypothetical protein
MKTTVEISDSLLHEVRGLAAREDVTLRSLVERGLRQIVADAKQERPFKLRHVTFKDRGLRPELRDAPWSTIRDMIYEGRGGDPSVPRRRG